MSIHTDSKWWLMQALNELQLGYELQLKRLPKKILLYQMDIGE